jgi:hypothetical protein
MEISLSRGWYSTMAAGAYYRFGVLVICRMEISAIQQPKIMAD